MDGQDEQDRELKNKKIIKAVIGCSIVSYPVHPVHPCKKRICASVVRHKSLYICHNASMSFRRRPESRIFKEWALDSGFRRNDVRP
jgi:hypothetical protein